LTLCIGRCTRVWMLTKSTTSLGQTVRAIRKATGMTVGTLCTKAGVSRQTLTGLELGYPDQSNPKIETVVAIAQGLGVEVSALFGPPPAANDSPGKRSASRARRSPASKKPARVSRRGVDHG